jgi:hypothetical protein
MYIMHSAWSSGSLGVTFRVLYVTERSSNRTSRGQITSSLTGFCIYYEICSYSNDCSNHHQIETSMTGPVYTFLARST